MASAPWPWRGAWTARPGGGWGVLVALSRAVGSGWLRRLAPSRDGARNGALAGGDFTDRVLPHLDAAYSLARFLTRDAEAAEDVVQEAVLKAHRGFAGYRGGDAKAWLLTIVRRQFLDWVDVRRAERTVFADVRAEAEAELAHWEHDNPEEALVRKGDVGAVRAAIADLPEPFREAIVLRELEELTYAQVSAVTGAPIGTVMSRLARGRELLARRLVGAAQPSEVGR
jgi:RNA polymerase sigma factor (sigma-70 family)